MVNLIRNALDRFFPKSPQRFGQSNHRRGPDRLKAIHGTPKMRAICSTLKRCSWIY